MSQVKGELVPKADAKIATRPGRPFSQRCIENAVLSNTEVLASTYTAKAAALVHAQGARQEFAARRRLDDARYVDGVSTGYRSAVVPPWRPKVCPQRTP